VHFVIHYSIAPDFEDEALALARRLFAHFDEAIDSLALIPDGQDELDLYLDGALIHSYRQSGRLPRVSDVTARPKRW
jgi:predicted Rdx family selenoprotein